jgi:hypothetical protein
MSTFHIGCTAALCLPEILRCVFRRFHTSRHPTGRAALILVRSQILPWNAAGRSAFSHSFHIPYGAVLEDIKFASICFRGSTAACCCWSFKTLNSHSSTFVGPRLPALLSCQLSTCFRFSLLSLEIITVGVRGYPPTSFRTMHDLDCDIHTSNCSSEVWTRCAIKSGLSHLRCVSGDSTLRLPEILYIETHCRSRRTACSFSDSAWNAAGRSALSQLSY